MPITIDFTGASSGFEAIPAGEYDGTIVEIVQGKSANGNPTIYFRYGELEGLDDPKRRLQQSFSLLPQALWKLKGHLDSLGVDVPEGEFDFEPDDLLGTGVHLSVSVKPKWDDPSKEDNEIDEVTLQSAGTSMSWGT
jgi:hypothetical protein